MRLFEKQKQTKTPMQAFNEMMVGISEIIELYDSQLIKDNSNGKEVIYNYVMKNENGLPESVSLALNYFHNAT